MRVHPRFLKYYKYCEKECPETCKDTVDCVVFASCGPYMDCAFDDIGKDGIIPCPKCYCWTAEGMTTTEINENIKALDKIVSGIKKGSGK